jgi:hypothetical protein
MLYAQIPPHLMLKAPRKAPVEPPKPVSLVDDSVVRHANEKMNAMLEMEYHRQTALELDEHYSRRSAEILLEAQRHPRAVSSRWGENITDVRLGW